MDLPIVLISDGLFHPSLPARWVLAHFLGGLPGYCFQRVASLEALTRLDLSPIRALVLYIHHKAVSSTALDALEGFIQQGGGMLAIHSASASFKTSHRFHALLGGRFIRHGPVENITLQPTGESSLFAGIPAFTLRDELYRHECDPANTLHFTVEVGGEQEPFVWSRTVGAGRVLYLAPGHTLAAVQHPQVQEILRRGLDWASGRVG